LELGNEEITGVSQRILRINTLRPTTETLGEVGLARPGSRDAPEEHPQSCPSGGARKKEIQSSRFPLGEGKRIREKIFWDPNVVDRLTIRKKGSRAGAFQKRSFAGTSRLAKDSSGGGGDQRERLYQIAADRLDLSAKREGLDRPQQMQLAQTPKTQ